MDDAEAIRALIHCYAELLDAGDLDGVAALFERATWRSARTGQVLRGAEQVRRVYDALILYEGTPCTHHVISNVTVVCDGTPVATARSAFTILQARPDFPLQPVLAGRCHDEFERVGDEWCFSDRLVFADLLGDLSRLLHPVDPSRPGPTPPA